MGTLKRNILYPLPRPWPAIQNPIFSLVRYLNVRGLPSSRSGRVMSPAILPWSRELTVRVNAKWSPVGCRSSNVRGMVTETRTATV